MLNNEATNRLGDGWGNGDLDDPFNDPFQPDGTTTVTPPENMGSQKGLFFAEV